MKCGDRVSLTVYGLVSTRIKRGISYRLKVFSGVFPSPVSVYPLVSSPRFILILIYLSIYLYYAFTSHNEELLGRRECREADKVDGQ